MCSRNVTVMRSVRLCGESACEALLATMTILFSQLHCNISHINRFPHNHELHHVITAPSRAVRLPARCAVRPESERHNGWRTRKMGSPDLTYHIS
jgi:hypothetical protein